MRNLKKFLALALAMMMIFGLMVTANASDYTDADSINDAYTEAVDVTSALGVFKGRDGNTFAPKATITRGEFAAALYRIRTGDTAETYLKGYANQVNFNDVKSTDWYAEAVGYAQKNGLIQGYAGNFYPTANISGYDVVVTLLRILGYGNEGEYTGSSYQVNAAIDANRAGITTIVSTRELNGDATREMIAQLIFDTLRYGVPTYYWTPDGDGEYSKDNRTTNIPIGEMVFKLHKHGEPDSVSSTGVVLRAKRYEAVDAKIQLPEDPYGRKPDYTWVANDGDILVPVADIPAVVFDTKMAPGEALKVLKALGITKFADKNVTVNVNGDANAVTGCDDKPIDVGYDHDGDGGSVTADKVFFDWWTSQNNRVVEVYVNTKNQITNVVIIEVLAYKLTKGDVVAAKGAKDAHILVPDDTLTSGSKFEFETDAYKVGDVVVYAYGKDGAGKNIVVAHEKAEAYKGAVKKVDIKRDKVDVYTIGDNVYERLEFDDVTKLTYNDLGETYTYYLDSLGQICYIDKEEEYEFGSYAQIVKGNATATTWNGARPTFQVQLLTSEGTLSTYSMQVRNKDEIDAIKKDGSSVYTAASNESYKTVVAANPDGWFVMIDGGDDEDYGDEQFVMVVDEDGAKVQWSVLEDATVGSLKLSTQPVYEYSVSGSTVTLTLVYGVDTTDGGYVAKIKNGSSIVKNSTSVLLDDGKTAVINSSTVFILSGLNAKENAPDMSSPVKVTGSASLNLTFSGISDNNIDGSSADLVIETITDENGENPSYVVKYVFAPGVVGGKAVAKQDTFYYVNPSDYIGAVTTAGKVEYQYLATRADGEEDVITVSKRVTSASVYQKASDGTSFESVGAINNKELLSKNGNTWNIGGTYVFVNDESIAVYIDGASVLEIGSMVFCVTNSDNVVVGLWVTENPS